MGNRISNSSQNIAISDLKDSLIQGNPTSVKPGVISGDLPQNSNDQSKLAEGQFEANRLKFNLAVSVNSDNLEERAKTLAEKFGRQGMVSYDEISPLVSDLNKNEVSELKRIYQKEAGRDLLMDLSRWMPLEDKFAAFKILAPERINIQTEIAETGTRIRMYPPSQEVPFDSSAKYSLDLSDQIGKKSVSHLIKGEYSNVAEAGETFDADFPASKNGEPYNRLILFEVKYDGKPSEFYKYTQKAVNAPSKAENELNKMLSPAPASDLYLAHLDSRIDEAKTLLKELEAKKASLEAEIANGPTRTIDGSRNSSDVYTDLRNVNAQIERVKAGISELETSKVELSKAFSDAVGTPIPLQAVLIARENGQTIPLQLYAKNLGGGKWAILDATNPSKPRSYVGEGMLPTDALNAAWKNFVSSTNDLPAGQIAAVKSKGLGITNENTPWNAQSAGKSTLKQFSDGIGKGSLLLAGVGVGALFVPGGQPIGVGLLLTSGVGGGISSGMNLADRVNNGTFKLRDSETALDVLGIVGGLTSLGGLAALTNAGSKGLSIVANGTKFNAQRFGDVIKISTNTIEHGTNAAGAIIIQSQYVSAIEEVQKSGSSPEQKQAQIRNIIFSAIAAGGIMMSGVFIGRKFNPPSDVELNNLLKKTRLNPEIENLVRSDQRIQKVFVNNGEDTIRETYADFLQGGKTGNGLKVRDYGEYLSTRGYSTGLDKSTDSVTQVLGKDNFAKMSPEQINKRILELTSPNFYAGFKNLPKKVRDSIDATLKTDLKIGAETQFTNASSKLNKTLYEGIGKQINSVAELRKTLQMIESPSARGSIGNGYAQENLIEGENIKEFGFNPKLWTGTKSIDRRADNLLINGRSTLDIKTGYPKGYPNGEKEVSQLLDYIELVKASQSEKNGGIRDLLLSKGVKGGELKTHDYLFLTNGETNAKDVAIRSFKKIEKSIGDDIERIRVFYQDDNGKIYQLVKMNRQLLNKSVGTRIPNR